MIFIEINLYKKIWLLCCFYNVNSNNIKGTVIQTEKALINDRLRVSKVS